MKTKPLSYQEYTGNDKRFLRLLRKPFNASAEGIKRIVTMEDEIFHVPRPGKLLSVKPKKKESFSFWKFIMSFRP